MPFSLGEMKGKTGLSDGSVVYYVGGFSEYRLHALEAESMYESKLRSEQMDLLMHSIVLLKSDEEAYRFFEDLCTIAEMKSMAQRLEVAVLLREKVTYQEIARRTGASTATISRVNRALTYGAEGYNLVLNRLDLPQSTESNQLNLQKD